MSKQEENDVDGDDEKDKVSWYVNQQNKTANIIKKYNIGTLQMFISPEILSLTSKDRKKIDKIYYKREYTVTPSELQKSQKDYEKELALQKSQKEQKEQRDNIVKQDDVPNVVPPAPPAIPPPRPVAPIAPIAPNAPNTDLKKKQLMIGGGFFDSDFNDNRDRFYDRERERERIEPYNGMEARLGARPGITNSFGTSSALNRATMDLEPFIASLIKFNNTGFPVNATIKARVDTFFNINLFKAFLKRLGEPIKLYGADNQIISVDDVVILNEPKDQKKDDGKKKVFETDQTTEGSFITNWYPAQEKKKLIGSVYAFIYNTPTEQEMKQMSDMGKKIPQASMLMIKEGDNYRLMGGPIDNREKVYTGYGVPTVSSSKINSVTEENTVANQINSDYRKVTGQSSLPVAITNTGLRFIYEPESSNGKDVNANSDISNLKSVIYTRQVTNSQMESIIESSRATSTDIVKVPIATLSNILNGKSQAIQIKIDLNPNTAKVLKFLFRILEKQNLLSAISGKQKKKAGEIYDDRIKILRDKLSESSLNELDAIIRHNIRFILDVLFSTKTTFKYKGIDYIVDYLEWNNTFKQLKKILENYKVAYYIELELFLEKLEKGKLAIDRDGTLFSSCAVKGSQIKNFWRRNFLEQNWSKVGRQIKNSIKVTTTPSITDILPGFIKKALNVGSSQVMSELNPGVNQISFVQYCFLGQEQLIQEFKNIDNSFAGVSWKNENSWSKRKEILFNAMDVCGSDVYCFQNVQCSMESYRTIINSLTDAEKETLEDITTTSKQSDRIKIHRKVLNQLLEKIDDPLNLLAQIYERYKQGYFFIYFFEQNYIGGTLSALSKKTALGNLTMFKSDKFELKDETDIRMGAFISKNKKTLDGISSIQAIYGNTSFATVAYCTFKGGKYTKPSSLPGQIPGSFVASTSTPLQIGAPSKLPGISGYSGTIKVSDIDDVIPEEGRGDDVQGIEDYIEEPAQNISSAPSEKRVQAGGGDDDGEWYNQDNSEQVGLFSGLFGNKDMGKQSKIKPEAEPCKKYMNQSYIPGGQIFGIINIKLETAETLKQIESKQFASVMPGIPGIPAKTTVPGEPATSDKKITKQMIEVLLIAAFISKFRSRYYLSSSTDINPYFMAGDFNFDIPYDKQIIKSDISNVYSQAPALALLLTRSNNVFKPENYPLLSGYTTQIIDFIRMCKILTYLYGGAGKNGRLRLNGYTNSQTLPNMFGHKYSLTNPEKINKSGLIFTTGKLILCPKEEMNKIVNSESSEGLPVYPNKSNPSNSEAIGGVFELETAFVYEVIKQVAIGESEEQQNQRVALQDEAKRSIIEELTGRPIGTSTDREDSSVSPYARSPSISPSRGVQGVSDGEAEAEADAEAEEIPDWGQSTSGKPSTSYSVKIVPDAIQIAGENLTKLHNLEYTASKAETVKGSPYKKSVFICETGKPDYNYLTSLEMTKWETSKDKIYSDHSPIMYNINNANKNQCGPQVAVGQQSVMSGGAFPAEIKLITWNIASHGGEGSDKSKGLLFYFHKFNGKMKEGIEHYKSRLANNARAIREMMKGGYDYTLIQEGPTYVLESSLNKEEALSEPFKYKEFLTSAIRNNESGDGSDGSVKLDIVPSEITDYTKYFGEFYLVVNKSTVDITQIKSLGFLIKSGKNMFSNNEAEIVFNGIIQTVEQQNVPKYERGFIIKDCSRLWFFVNTKSKQILTSTHLSLSEENTPKMYERQRQVYVLLNSVIFYLRQDPVYRDYDIIFSGDFNINLLQPFPTDVEPTFLKCKSVARQQTFIYTSKNNAPSSFGGENEAKYNPTNIDFTVFYPKVRPSVSLKTKKVDFVSPISQSSLPSPTSILVPSSSSSAQRKVKVSKITYYTQNKIFEALQVTPSATNLLDKNVSVINTDYSMEYARSNIMPPGSATLLNIRDKPLNNITYTHPDAATASPSELTVKYMIQASPGMSGTGELITRDTLSNSVMNSLILATLNGVKNIIFPFIGGEIFFKKLEAVEKAAGRVHSKTEHAKMLLKGVTDFYEFMKVNKINKIGSTLQKIYFCPWGKEEVDALYVAKSDASTSNRIINTVLHISGGTRNLIEETINLAKRSIPVLIDAIVNAANVEMIFGNGVSSMCFAAIGNDDSKQKQLDGIKTQFIEAFKKYMKQQNDDNSSSSYITKIAKEIRNNTLLKLGVPRGYVTTRGGDTYDVGIEEGNSIVIKRIDDLKLNDFYLTKDSGNFIHGIPAGSSLFYYDIKRKDSNSNYIKCWFSFDAQTFRTDFKSNINATYSYEVFNPIGSDGMIVWLDTSTTAKELTSFSDVQKKEIGKVINNCILNLESSYVDVVKYFINSQLDTYKHGATTLNEKLKDKIIELAKQINLPVPDDITSWEDIKDWSERYVPPPPPPPSVSPAAPVVSVSTSSTTKTAITQINGIKKRASVADFNSAQRKGFKAHDKIAGGVHENIIYNVDGSTFEQALKEINAGKKESHWMWYIFPSDLRVQTPCSTFFRLGPQATNDAIGNKTIRISEYLKDEYLRKNYMTITEALYDKVDEMLKDEDKVDEMLTDEDKVDKMLTDEDKKTPQKILKEIMVSNIDYLKLKRSISNFYKPLKTKINEMSISGGTKFIKKMNILNYILNDIIDSRYPIEDDKRVEIETGYYRLLEEEAESSRESTVSSPEKDTATSPEKNTDPDAVADTTAPDTIAPDTTAAAAAAPDEDVDSPDKEDKEDKEDEEDVVLESIPKLNANSKSRVLSLEQILKLMILNIQNNVFIVSGGSYNPPHNGHIKMFETAYDTLRTRDTPSGEKGYYGIMVVATRRHLMSKISKTKEILNSGDRIKLCKLACDTYNWKHDNFNSNNMLILDVADDSPTRIIINKIQKILKAKLKINNLFYLCGSDFFIKYYSESSKYSVIYILRKLEEDAIDAKIQEVNAYGNSYSKIPVFIEDSEEYDLSSSVVRDNIYKLKNSKSWDNKIRNEIIKFIGLSVYCYLGDLNYLVEKKNYGDKCDKRNSSLTDELISASAISTGPDIDGDEDSSDSVRIGDGYYIDLSVGSTDDIPEKDKNIFMDINTESMFDSQTIENARHFDNVMNALIHCGEHRKDINYKQIKVFLKRIYDKGLYYILNDLSYFQANKIDPKHCFIPELFSNGGSNTNLLENMPLITTQEFNREYLTENDDATENLTNLVALEKNYLRGIDDKLDEKTYKDYDGNPISKAMVIDILGFLYESESYSLYLYIIGDDAPTQGKDILIKLYSTLLEQKNDKVESILTELKDKVSYTIESSHGKIPDLTRSMGKRKLPKVSGDPPVGSEQLLKAAGYVNMKTTPNGNCFYNAIGMLSSEYSRNEVGYDKYKSMDTEKRDDVQYKEQSRVRRDLTTFLTNIYNLIKDVVNKESKEYKESPILKYIMRKGRGGFKYVSKIARRVGYDYFGSDSEIYFASLFYAQPIVTVTGISGVNSFNLFYWDTYNINSTDGTNGTPFLEYLRNVTPETTERDANAVIQFLSFHSNQFSYDIKTTSDFLLNYPHSYFLIGGMGHWTYAVNENLIKGASGASGASGEEGHALGGGGNNNKISTYTPRFTKKRKNRYYKKDTETLLQKTTKKHKKTRRANKNKDNKDNILKNKKHIKKTIKQSNSL
jgi:nicotinic acid mononucleotide adenylyltransferase/O-acetyl-ADP-ribose deacetylase (regulator of RNase III)